ncbi:hypothetical protein ACFQZC_22055 [Streptacidiphilus monticola]
MTVGIGRHYTGTVSIWAQPSGGARVLLRKVYLSNDASLAIPYTFTRNTTFTAGYSGDTGYSAVSRIRTVTTSARLSTALRGWYTSSGSWRVYHRTAKKQLSVALAAPQPGKCVRVTVQQYVSGRWKTVRSTACARLASNSTLLWTVPSPPLSEPSTASPPPVTPGPTPLRPGRGCTSPSGSDDVRTGLRNTEVEQRVARVPARQRAQQDEHRRLLGARQFAERQRQRSSSGKTGSRKRLTVPIICRLR